MDRTPAQPALQPCPLLRQRGRRLLGLGHLIVACWTLLVAAPAAAEDAFHLALIDLSDEQPWTREIAFEVARALKKSKQVRYSDLDGALNLGGEELQKEGARSADGQVKSALVKMKAGQWEDAAEDLDNAVGNYLVAYAVLADTTALPKALAWLATAQLMDGDAKSALKTFERAVQSDQKVALDVSEWSPKAQALLDAARKNVAARDAVDFEIKTDPPNARVYVNGRFMGLTPTFATSVKGEQFITISKQGFVRKARKVNVDKANVVVDERLDEARRAAAFEGLKRGLLLVLDGKGSGETLADTEGLTSTPYVVLLRAVGTREKTKIELALAGLNSRQVIHQVQRELNLDNAKVTREVVEKLVDEVLRPRVVAAGVDPGVVAAKPIYQRWWFWGIVAAVAGGSAAAYALTAGEPPAPSVYNPNTGGLLIQF